ncbi:hypothetical protein C0992_005210, partial [Termitomyces sp. T32_za158]
MASSSDLTTFKQPMKSEDADKWNQAAVNEYVLLVANGTWKECDLPEGKKAIGSGW